IFVEDNFSMDLEGMVLVLLPCPPLTSSCAAQFLTGHRLVLVRSPGVGDSCCKGQNLHQDISPKCQIYCVQNRLAMN
uniref:Uncharacterized protein n=1 Tax=Laticauda laticaudata TaxID=8630 RepID=A0A8C5RGY3_LATLA